MGTRLRRGSRWGPRAEKGSVSEELALRSSHPPPAPMFPMRMHMMEADRFRINLKVAAL